MSFGEIEINGIENLVNNNILEKNNIQIGYNKIYYENFINQMNEFYNYIKNTYDMDLFEQTENFSILLENIKQNGTKIENEYKIESEFEDNLTNLYISKKMEKDKKDNKEKVPILTEVEAIKLKNKKDPFSLSSMDFFKIKELLIKKLEKIKINEKQEKIMVTFKEFMTSIKKFDDLGITALLKLPPLLTLLIKVGVDASTSEFGLPTIALVWNIFRIGLELVKLGAKGTSFFIDCVVEYFKTGLSIFENIKKLIKSFFINIDNFIKKNPIISAPYIKIINEIKKKPKILNNFIDLINGKLIKKALSVKELLKYKGSVNMKNRTAILIVVLGVSIIDLMNKKIDIKTIYAILKGFIDLLLKIGPIG